MMNNKEFKDMKINNDENSNTMDSLEIPNFVNKQKTEEGNINIILSDLSEIIRILSQYGNPTTAKIKIMLEYDNSDRRSTNKKTFKLKKVYK